MSWLLVLLVAKLLGWDDLARAAGVATVRFVFRLRARRRDRARLRAIERDLERRQLQALARTFGRCPVRIVDTVLVEARRR